MPQYRMNRPRKSYGYPLPTVLQEHLPVCLVSIVVEYILFPQDSYVFPKDYEIRKEWDNEHYQIRKAEYKNHKGETRLKYCLQKYYDLRYTKQRTRLLWVLEEEKLAYPSFCFGRCNYTVCSKLKN